MAERNSEAIRIRKDILAALRDFAKKTDRTVMGAATHLLRKALESAGYSFPGDTDHG